MNIWKIFDTPLQEGVDGDGRDFNILNDSVVTFKLPFDVTHPPATIPKLPAPQLPPPPVPTTPHVSPARLVSGPSPPPSFSPKNTLNKVEYILHGFSPDYVIDVANNTRDRGNQEPGHQWCKDDNTIEHLDQILNYQNDAINSVNAALGQLGDLNSITDLYNSIVSNYDSRLALLKARYDALGTPEEMRAKVDTLFAPSIKTINDETANYSEDNSEKTKDIRNYETTIMPLIKHQDLTALSGLNSAKDKLDVLTEQQAKQIRGIFYSIGDENALIRDQLDQNADSDTRYTRKSNFMETKYEELTRARGILFTSYYVLVAIILALLIFRFWNGPRMQWVTTFVVVVGLAIFPFLAYPFELTFYQVCSFVYALARGTPYITPKTLFPEESPINLREQKPPRSLNVFSDLYHYLLNVPLWAFFLLVFGGIIAYTVYSMQ